MYNLYFGMMIPLTAVWLVCLVGNLYIWLESKSPGYRQDLEKSQRAAKRALVTLPCVLLIPFWPITMPVLLLLGAFRLGQSLIADMKATP